MGFSLSLPIPGQPFASEGVKVGNDFTTLQTWGNGNILGTDLSPTAAIAATQLAAGAGRLAVRTVSGNVTAAVGDLIWCTGSPPYTITLPAPANNAVVGVAMLAVPAGGAVTVTAASGHINALGAIGATSISLGTQGACVLLQSNGTDYSVIAGQQDSGWLALSLTGGVSQVGGTYTPGYRLIGDRVWLRGGTSFAATASQSVFTLPAGFRPASTVTLPMLGGNMTSASISTVGVLLVGSGTTTSNAYLDGVSFSLT